MNDTIHTLIADTDPISRQLFYEAAKQYHMNLVVSESLDETRWERRPDLLFTSLASETLTSLQKILTHPSPPTIIAGYAEDTASLAKSALDSGVWTVLKTPCSPLELQTCTKNGIERAKLIKTAATAQHVYEKTHAANAKESLEILAGGLSHDFNNILSIVLSNARLLGKRPENDSAIRSTIINAAKRAVNLTNQLVEYSGKGHYPLKAIPNLTTHLTVAISKMEQELPGCPIHFKSTGPPLPVYADTSQIIQVLKNLVYNAAEASDETGNSAVYVETDISIAPSEMPDGIQPWENHPDGECAVIRVRDTGCGIPAENLGRVFSPFFSTKFIGRGLGLSAVIGIVRRHGGTISIQSTEGKGTEVSVYLPLYQISNSLKPDEVVDTSLPKGTILVVDDDEICRALARTMLERLSYVSLIAKDGIDAVEIFKKNQDRISCVLLDMVMPRMNGEACFREIKKMDPKMKIIMASGFDYYDAVDGLTKEGLNGFLSKPYQFKTLAETLKKVLG